VRFSAKCEVESLKRAAKATGVPLEVLDVWLPELRKLYERDLALIRPDQYICWRGDRLPDDVEGLLRVVTGQTLKRQEER
jgi:Aromatic-ring hydroxylase, C-terminal